MDNLRNHYAAGTHQELDVRSADHPVAGRGRGPATQRPLNSVREAGPSSPTTPAPPKGPEIVTSRVESPPSRTPEQGILRPTAGGWQSVLTAVVVALLVTAAGFVVKAHTVDAGAVADLNRLRTGLLGALTTGVYHVFSPVPAVLLTVVVTAVIWARTRDLRTAAAFAGVVAGTWLPSAVVKVLVQRPRPELATLAHPYAPALTDFSYPSGHTVFITSLAIALALVVRDTRWRSTAATVGAVVVALVALALVVDGVHFPTDVAASVVWALAVAPAVRYLWVDLVMPRLPLLGDARTASDPAQQEPHA